MSVKGIAADALAMSLPALEMSRRVPAGTA